MSHQEKYNRNLLISLLVLVVVTLVYVGFYKRDRSVVDTSAFQLTDFTTINEVTLERGQHKTTLNFDGVRWNVNGELADRNLIDVLFATLQQARPVRPVAQALRDSVNRILEASAVKVSLRSDDQTRLEFLAGGNARKSEAYFKRAGDDAVYVMVIPGYRVYVSGIFELDKSGWKDKRVYQLNWRNFQRLETTFPESPKDDFKVSLIENYFSIENMAAVDTTKLNDYLDAVSLLMVDEYLADNEVYENLINTPPQVKITAYDIGGRSYSLALYQTGPVAGKKYGLVNQSQLAYFDLKKLEAITKTRSSFAPSR
ncbi:MAG: DUF4340 domain-containing protein [Cyclobacteriaceae bacterium]|nr:DUF4340 domain-containing protein [Cyclobacteriaceae bacterium]UYN86142.1 MAG: DUF4340 domain-containing protein [Cyclobacteriaceae bacterium]